MWDRMHALGQFSDTDDAFSPPPYQNDLSTLSRYQRLLAFFSPVARFYAISRLACVKFYESCLRKNNTFVIFCGNLSPQLFTKRYIHITKHNIT